MIEGVQEIFARMADELSRKIYIDRLNYSITQNNSYIDGMVEQAVRSRESWRDFCRHLKERAADGLYLYGAGVWGKTLYEETQNLLVWQGIIDSQADKRKIFGTKVIHPEAFAAEYDKNASVVISSHKYGREMEKTLRGLGVSPDKILNGGKVIYRLTEGAAYFDLEALLPLRSYEVFIDGGAFDGATTLEFMKWCDGNGYAFCFEADSKNIATAAAHLSGIENCEIVHKALWSKNTSLYIDMKGNCSSAVSEEKRGENIEIIETAALDDVVGDRPVTYIKMDIEGAELEALQGAENIIRKQHPRLAVSIYHKPEDIWTIPRLLMKYYEGYWFYMRHYSFSWYDTVLYAIPQEPVINPYPTMNR